MIGSQVEYYACAGSIPALTKEVTNMKGELSRRYSIDELNNLELGHIIDIEEDAYDYFKKVRAVRKFTEELENEKPL